MYILSNNNQMIKSMKNVAQCTDNATLIMYRSFDYARRNASIIALFTSGC